jgi:uncharacterized protein
MASMACGTQPPKAAATSPCATDPIVEGFFRAQTIRCSWGVAEQCELAGAAYQLGLGVERDLAQAREYFRRACALGAQDGCVLSGVVALELGERQQAAEIVAAWERACESGSFTGCHAAGTTLTMDPQKLGIAKNMPQGRAYLAKACAMRYLPACGLDAYLTLQQQETASYARAHTQLVEACGLRERESCHHLAKMELDGTFGPKNESAAVQHFWQACKLGLGAACGAVAYLIANGRGVRQDLRRAKSLVEEACSRLGYAAACDARDRSSYDSLAP